MERGVITRPNNISFIILIDLKKSRDVGYNNSEKICEWLTEKHRVGD